MEIANSSKNKELQYRTYPQWMKLGRIPLPGVPGTEMFSNGYCQRKYMYWSLDQTREATPEEQQAFWRGETRKNRNRREQKAFLKKQAEEWEAEKRRLEAQKQEREAFRDMMLEYGQQEPVKLCANPSGIVVFDLETTGLDPCNDEILQFSAIDGDGNVLLSTLLCPYVHTSWPDAEHIHGISPEMVRDQPQIHQLIPAIRGIFQSAGLIVSYNGRSFDESFLNAVGVFFDNTPHFDVMFAFAPVYGEWDEYHGDYKWKSLSTCAEYYGYQFKAHDALEDCRATLYCYKALQKEGSEDGSCNHSTAL